MIHTFCILQNGFTFNQWCGSKHSGCARCSSKNCTVYTQNTCNDLLNSWQYGWKITAFQMRSLPKSWCFQGKTLKWVTYPLEVLEMNCKSNDHRHNIHAQLPPPPPLPNTSKKLQFFCTHSLCESDICHIHSPDICISVFSVRINDQNSL